MTSSTRYWVPKTVQSPHQLLLAVQRKVPPMGEPQPAMTKAEHRRLMAEKVEALAAATGLAAVGELLEMSAEQLPELAAIRADLPQEQWVTGLMASDAMAQLLNLIEWPQEKGMRPASPRQAEVREALEAQSLAELIEGL